MISTSGNAEGSPLLGLYPAVGSSRSLRWYQRWDSQMGWTNGYAGGQGRPVPLCRRMQRKCVAA